MKSVLLRYGDTIDPDEVKVPKAPYDWVDPPPNTEKEEPTFEQVYNPVGCSSFSYCPIIVSISQGANTRLIVSQLTAIQFLQTRTMLT